MRRAGLLFSVILLIFGASFTQAQDAFTVVEDVAYAPDGGVAHSMDIITPTENAKGIGLIYVVSRGYVSEKFPVATSVQGSIESGGRLGTLVVRGYTLFFVRHRSAPEHNVLEAWEDMQRAVRFIRRHADDYGIDPEMLGVFGNSAGGHLALMCAVLAIPGDEDSDDPVEREPVRVAAAGAYYPPTDLRTVISPDADLEPLRFDPVLAESVSPITHIDPRDPPILFVHGDRDRTVPIESSSLMHNALKRVGVETRLVVIEGAGHSFRGKNAEIAATALADWFDQWLASAGGI